MTDSKHWTLNIDEKGIAWLHLHRQDSKINTLSTEVMKELESYIHQIEQKGPTGLVILSDKSSGFIAGADVSEFTSWNNEEETYQYIKYCQSLFNRIEELPCPSVALINGFCMGGGTELSLSCQYRILLDSPSTRIGLPEIKLGIHPGFGGTVKSIRLMGPLSAMDMMLTGRALSARAARKTGLCDYVVPERHMLNAARKIILEKKPTRKKSILSKIISNRLIRPLVAHQMRKRVAKKASRTHYPAPFALIDLWEKYADSSQMMEHEARSISKLLATDTAQNLIRVFFLQSTIKENGKQSDFRASHIHVVGAGVMGGDIAAWCVLKGLTVTLQDQSPDRIAPAIKRAAILFKKKLKIDRLVTSAMDRLIPDVEGYGIKRADVVIEAIFENLNAKQNLFKDLESQVHEDTLLCTNTSSIPLEEISQVLKKPERLTGLHFFNPVDKMQLIEIVHSEDTDEEKIKQTSAFAIQISRLPVKVKSTPGFLVNRILMPYLLEASFMAQEGIPVVLIDKAALDFGMPMGPIELADRVGLDICLSVAEILSQRLGGIVPDILQDRVTSGNLGIKTGKGFYEYHNGKPIKPKSDKKEINMNDIQDRLILRLLNEAIACLREGVVESEELLDAGIIFGTGFAPFTGGPLNYLHTLSINKQQSRFDEFNRKYGDRFIMDKGWENILC